MKKRITTLLSVLFFATAIWAQSEEEAAGIVKRGDDMPSFKLSSSVYGDIDSHELKGKVVLISIFAIWCPPCQKELKAISEQLYPRFKDNGDFRMLVVGREHTDKELSEYNKKKKFDFALYPDPEREFTAKFATKFIPRTYLVDKEGKVVYTASGYKDEDFKELMRLIDRLL